MQISCRKLFSDDVDVTEVTNGLTVKGRTSDMTEHEEDRGRGGQAALKSR